MKIPSFVKAVVRRLATGMYAALEVLGLPRMPPRREPPEEPRP